ncbi:MULTISPECIES: hypothetical protein [Nitrosomonas]|uniref:hypothetical protein n=1 Tax=Nitrosomonas TaxID=914 RepID=UPI000A77BB43|nr:MULTISPECIES: hypothetical protein [Nitrosomonas]UVS60208.1 hypothetical protein NX761_11855 [Nitrosomonas sp. PLL12]
MQHQEHGVRLQNSKAETGARVRSSMTPIPLKRASLPSGNGGALDGENYFYARL